jgi:DNA-binding transcriptional LysR family regulator
MDIKQLRALLAVAEAGSVTKAAEALHIVQPAVSRQLKLLEEDIGTSLFERGRYGMELTDAGDILVQYARRALLELDRARTEIQPSTATVSGIATIGLLPSTAGLLAGQLVERVKAQYPAIELRIVVGYAGHLQQWLEAGEVDAALLYDARTLPTLQAQPLLEESLMLVGPGTSALKLDSPVRFSELNGWPMIVTSSPHAIRSLLDRACREAGVKFDVVTATNSLDIQKSLVIGGHGYTVLPSIAIQDELAQGKLKAAPLTEPELVRQISLALPNIRRLATPVRCTTQLLVDVIHEAVANNVWPSRWLGPIAA